MKRSRLLLMMLIVAMLILSVPVSYGESGTESTQTADIRMLMDDDHVPKVTNVHYEYPESAEAMMEHSFVLEKKTGFGKVIRVQIDLIREDDGVAFDWESVNVWLEGLAKSALAGDQSDTELIAREIDRSVKSNVRRARFMRKEKRPEWADRAFRVRDITVTAPYFPALRPGDRGDAVRSLQEKLCLLGFLTDQPDGFFGKNTEAAVEQLERYVRELERDMISAVGMETMPGTPVDGVADPVLQAYLYSDDYTVSRMKLEQGSEGEEVRRLQIRLQSLGYVETAADGIYGSGTARAVRTFQHYNAMERTGEADEMVQRVLFSENAKKPSRTVLKTGSSGREVRELQNRLKSLGFMNAAVDGEYGKSTANGVRVLQQYMRDAEIKWIRENTGTEEYRPSVDVNGIADALLLEDFYAESFPAVPRKMQNGDANIDVVRVQRRLRGLEYYFGSYDGSYGVGTENAVRAFQKENGLEQSGVAGKETLSLLFSEQAKKSHKPYLLKISTAEQRVYAYVPDRNGEYTRLVRTMKCSTGKDITPTPKGTFQGGTGPGARWHYFKKYQCWAQYAYYIDGDIMFHSVLYNEKNGPVTQSSVNNLGRKASHGCVRLSVDDARWIYRNCPRNTKIIVY